MKSRRYYYIDANQQRQGPVDIHRLANLDISTETYIWTKGLANWTKAGNIPELRGIARRMMTAEELRTSTMAMSPADYAQNNSSHNSYVSSTDKWGNEMGQKEDFANHSNHGSVHNVKESASALSVFWSKSWRLWASLLCFALAVLSVYFLIWFFSDFSGGRVRVGIFLLPIMFVWYGLKALVSFIKHL